MSSNYLKKLALAALIAAGTVAGVSAQTTLASWTFDGGYDKAAGEGLQQIYTPNGNAWAAIGHYWFKDQVPVLRPDEAVGNSADYSMSAYSENRYWQLCEGYQNYVFRIDNSSAENNCSDYTDPSQHKAYFEFSFPTKGYKGISIDYAMAPGNNVVTPVKLIMSVDGGNSWFDGGTNDTSAAWYIYNKASVSISANNKDNVIVRLLPTVGTTNWNLDYFTVTAAEEAGATTVDSDIDYSWPFDKGPTSDLNAVASLDGTTSVASLSIGSNLLIKGIRTDGGISATMVEPVVGKNTANDEANALSFIIRPKKGLKFQSGKLSFQASRVGTNGGKFDVGVTVDGSESLVATNITPALVKNEPYYSLCEYDLSSLPATDGPVLIRIYIKDLDASKQYAFQNIRLSGKISGAIEEVPSYTLSLKSAIPAAGTISCTPGGAEFDAGTALTVSVTENFGYHFTSWTDASGKTVSTANPYSFEISENTELTANFDQNNVYPLNLKIEGGANVNQVLFAPEGNVVDGVHYYEEGTDVRLTTVNNRILTFNNWEDKTTAPSREIRMDGEKNLTAVFSADDYIVGWDFYFDQPASERAADYKAESDNAGLLSLRNPEGKTTSWLTRGVGNGAENGKWGARIWKNLSEQNYFEVSFSSVGYTNLVLSAALGISYNSYTVINAQYSTDGQNFNPFGTYNLKSGWTSNEFNLPAEAAGQQRVWIRFMPDRTSPLVGNTSNNDGLSIAELYILADRESANDDVPPVLVSTIPADGADGASATGSIILTFNEKVLTGTGNATLNGETIAPTLSGKSIVYNYNSLDYNTTYTFTVPAGAITDRSGNAFAGTTLTFTTMERSQPEARLFDAIVAQDGSGDYATVQDAIDAAPANRVKPWLIFVKNGNYNEHVDIPASKPMLHIIGQDRDKTVILDDKLCGGDNALHVSVGATVVVNSNDCLFENITLENSYGHERQEGPQALALNTTGDRTIFNNVAMLSYQDTWITPSTSAYRAYVRNSFIEGAVDFIYNSGDIFIDNTILYINRKSGGYIVAPSHGTDVKWGYVFNNCTITAPGVPSETSVWLGRPWHNYPKTVFLNTRAEVTIPATGWYETMGGLPAIWADWNTVDANGNPLDLSQRRDTYYYMDNGEKVYGKAKNSLTDEEAAQYTVRNVLSGSDNWEPVIKTESCATPSAGLSNGVISWDAVPYAICYLITKGDEVIGFTTETSMSVDPAVSRANESGYSIQAVNEFGGLSPKAAVINGSVTGISEIEADANGQGEIIEIYDLQGRRLNAPARGLNIVRRLCSDGSIKVEKLIF